ncbi:MAG: hypothetical protein LKM39_06770 [Chiayiivirga sp.]|nr:hypothetical protein [Chiayiivirga sp.]
MSLDTFQVLDAGVEFVDPERRRRERRRERCASPAPAGRCRACAGAPQPCRASCKHFRIPAAASIFADAGEGRTQMTLVCSDRPGLLAAGRPVLREHRLRVHDARIATFGERVEDLFQITDEADRPLRRERGAATRCAMRCWPRSNAPDDPVPNDTDAQMPSHPQGRRCAEIELRFEIESAWERRATLTLDRDRRLDAARCGARHRALEAGRVPRRRARRQGAAGPVNEWLKKAVLLYFRVNEDMR